MVVWDASTGAIRMGDGDLKQRGHRELVCKLWSWLCFERGLFNVEVETKAKELKMRVRVAEVADTGTVDHEWSTGIFGLAGSHKIEAVSSTNQNMTWQANHFAQQGEMTRDKKSKYESARQRT